MPTKDEMVEFLRLRGWRSRRSDERWAKGEGAPVMMTSWLSTESAYRMELQEDIDKLAADEWVSQAIALKQTEVRVQVLEDRIKRLRETLAWYDDHLARGSIEAKKDRGERARYALFQDGNAQ
jgi:hypothetical protein